MKLKTENTLILGYNLFLLSNIFIESEIHNFVGMEIFLRLIKYLGIMLCVFSCNNTSKIGIKNCFSFVFLLFLSFSNMLFFHGGSGLIEILIIVLCCTIKRIKISQIFKNSIILLISGHLFVIFLSLFGVINDDVSSRWFGNYMGSFFAGEYVRHKMGFLSSNQIPLTLMIVYLMLIVYKKEKIRFYVHLLFLTLNFYCFFYFGSRVSFLLIIFTFCLYVLVKAKEKTNFKKIHFTPLCWIIFIVCGIVSVMCSVFYNPNSHAWIIANQIFYNRLRWSHNVLSEYGASLLGFGTIIGKATGPNGENIIDNGYILLLMQRGIFLFVLIIGLWSFITFRAEKKKNYYLMISLFVIAIASLIDAHLLSYKMIPFYCIFTLHTYQITNFNKYCTKRKAFRWK